MMELVRRILECPARNKDCPVARRFRETAEGPLIPETYLGSPRAKFIIVGFNPGMTYNREGKPISLWSSAMSDFSSACFDDFYVKTYMDRIKDYLTDPFLKDTWQYDRACKIFNYSPENDEVMITNLAHCPTKKWGDLDEDEQNEIFRRCHQFCEDIIGEVDPQLVLLHGRTVVEFFSRIYGWRVNRKDVLPLKREENGRKYILSSYLQQPLNWRALENIAKTL
jgi:uracil-DNA glycosylase